ncbi:MAG: hypothetical protein V1676_03860 [Candidatus Diapherotrites archaeon]
MRALEGTTTVQIHGRHFFRTAIPRRLAIEMLGLHVDDEKQKIRWVVKGGAVVVGKVSP